MFDENELISSDDGIDISPYPVFMEEDNMCGYYFCIENNSNKKFSFWAKTGM